MSGLFNNWRCESLIKIYKDAALTNEVSMEQKPLLVKADGTQIDYNEIPGYPATADMTLYQPNPAYNPLSVTLPIAGGTQTIAAYYANDDSTKYYSGITATATDAIGTNESSEVTTSLDNVTFNATENIPDIGSTGTPDIAGHPIWFKVTAPAVSGSQNKTDIKIQIQADEYAV